MIATCICRRLLAARAVLVAFVVMACSAVAAQAQSPVDTAASRKPVQATRVDRATAPGGLELTAEQRTKLTAITNKHAEEGKAIGALLQTDPDAAMKRMVSLRTKMQAEVRAVLTAEQRTIFDRNVAEMNAQMSAHFPVAPR